MNTGGTETRAETEGGVGAIPEDPQHGRSSGAGKRRARQKNPQTSVTGMQWGVVWRGWRGARMDQPQGHSWGSQTPAAMFGEVLPLFLPYDDTCHTGLSPLLLRTGTVSQKRCALYS